MPVPGVLMRMALMDPPKLAPKKIEVSIKMPGMGSKEKVNGSNTVMARLPLSPGMAPKIMPMSIPILMNSRF